MQIREIYAITHKIGVLGASSPRQYIDLRGKSTKSLPIKIKKRETYFADIQKSSKRVPGPGKYEINPEDPKLKKVYKRVDFKAEAKKPRKNYIEQIIKEKKNIPGVGKYEIVMDKNDKIRQWHSILGDKARKKAPTFKNNIFDDCHVDCINVAPGSYNTSIPIVKINKFQTAAQTSRAEDTDEKEKKNSNSMPKLPGAQTYRPIPSQFDTFEKLLSQKKDHSHQSNFSKKKRFSAEKEMSPGPKYSLIAEWSPKNNGFSSKKISNIFKSMSNLRSPGIYH